MPATSPADSQLVANLRATAKRFAVLLEQEQARADRLASVVLGLIPVDPEPDHEHTHLLGDPRVCCLMAAHRIDGPARRRALEALDEWQATRTGQDAPEAPSGDDSLAKFIGKQKAS